MSKLVLKIKRMRFFALIILSSCILAQSVFSQNSTPGIKKIENHHDSEIGNKLIENKGQWPEGVLFQTNMHGGKLWVQQRKMIFHLQDFSAMERAHAMKDPTFHGDKIKETLVHLNFLGSNETNNIEKKKPTKFYYNYFKGNDPKKWASDVHGYETAILYDLYNGIDLKISGFSDEMKYEFLLQPKVKPELIQLNYCGQKSISIDNKGNLVLSTELGKIMEQKPYAYQIINGKEVKVKCQFKLEGSNVTFDLGKYDENYLLVIDPVLIFGTYDGANSDNFGMTATYGHDGTAYSAGTVFGNDYPNPDPLVYDINSNFTTISGNYGITDVFISKYSADGTQMIWGTFLGGGDSFIGTETAHSMICDSQDNVYLFGATSSYDFPITSGAYDNTHNGGNTSYNANFYYNGVYFQNLGTDIYVAKLSADGHTLIGSTFVGGSENDGVSYNVSDLPYGNTANYTGLNSNYGDQSRGEIMLDANNNILVASSTKSTDFPTANAFQNTNNGGQDGVIFKLAANFQNLLFSSYYGGSLDDACFSVKLDANENVIFAGGTKSTDLAGTAGGYQASYGGGTTDGYVVKLNSSGSSIIQSSYVGMSQYDQVFFVEIDRLDNVFLLGQSTGGTFPIFNAAYSNGTSSNFIIKLNPQLTNNLASTRFGNGLTNIEISPAAFLVDVCGNIYVSGWGGSVLGGATPLNNMPVTTDAFRATPPNGFDFYLIVIKRDFAGLLYGTYIGGTQASEHVDGGTSRFDKDGIVYQSVCGGCGAFSDFPTTPGAWSATNNSNNCNNIIYKFDTEVVPVANFQADQTQGCSNFTATLDNSSSQGDEYLWDFGNGNVDSVTFNPIVTYTTPGTYTINLYVTDSVCLLTDTARITITVLDSITINLPDTFFICNNDPFTLTVNSFGTGSYFIWSQNSDMNNPLNIPSDSTAIVSANGTYYIEVGNSFCDKKDSVYVMFNSPPQVSFNLSDTSGCAPLSVTFNNTSVQTSYFQWDLGNGNLDSLNYSLTENYDIPGTYVVRLIISDTTCTFSDSAFATVVVYPNVFISMDDTMSMCTSVPITISPTFTGNPTQFIWSTNSNFSDTLNTNLSQSQFLVNDPQQGYYYLNASNGNCSSSDSVFVQFVSASLSLSLSNSLCIGETATVTATNTNPQVSFSYSWSPSSIIVSTTNSNQITINPASSQYVYLSASSTNGCFIEDSIYVNVSYIDPTTVVASASEYNVLPGTAVVLSGLPNGLASYLWSPPTGLASPNQQVTNATVDETTIYTLTVSDGICSKSDTVQVKVYQLICDDAHLFIPNAFSPNSDNFNDILYLRGYNIEKMIFRIFDRWGEMVFETSDQSIGWDGTFRGKKLDPDVYDYYLDVTCVGGLNEIIKGNISLMK